MRIWRQARCRARAAAGAAVAIGLCLAGAAAAGPALAKPVLQLPPNSVAVSWGDNQNGELGNGSTAGSTSYAGVSGLTSGVAQVSAGTYDNAMALTTGGTVWTWGLSLALGTGSAANSTVPVQVPGLTGVTQISAGLGYDLALRSDGTVWAWGFNQYGELGDGNTTANSAPVQVTGLTGVTQIAAGNGFGLALRSDGTVWAWGWNDNGQLGDGTTTDSDVPVQVTGLTGVIQIAAGAVSAMALRVQFRRTSFVKTVWTWGGNRAGQLGDGTTTDRTTPELVSGINAPSITAIAAGTDSMVLGSDGSVWDWGPNTAGEVGNGTTTDELRPVKIWNSGVIAIAAGDFHSLALFYDGTVLAWGDGPFGSGTRSLVPVPVPGLSNVTQIAAGDYYSLAVHQVLPIYLGRVAGAGRLPGRGEIPAKSDSSAGLEAVYCTSAASCWTVGYFERNGALLNKVLHWDGHRWSPIAAPSPAGTASGDVSQLFGVRCTAARNCWAVGTYKRNGIPLDQALHWNGKSWSLVATPTPGGTLSGDFNGLVDVSCTSPDSCWADGEYGFLTIDSEVIQNQALHWNGRAWSVVTTPDPGGHSDSALSAIRCASANDCWAVGASSAIAPGSALFNEMLHWNGRKWSMAGVPDPGGTAMGDFSELNALSCTSAANCWATGSDGYDGSSALTSNQALHWNGHKWSVVPAPEPDGTGAFASNILTGVNCSSPDNCWAVGYIGNLDLVAPILNEALHWNGKHWSTASVPDPVGHADDDHSFLYGIRCTSRTSCWAVGQARPATGTFRNQLMHWNGATWSAK
jgi:alpha-tubulin suppressor-like RCC1 family protein